MVGVTFDHADGLCVQAKRVVTLPHRRGIGKVPNHPYPLGPRLFLGPFALVHNAVEVCDGGFEPHARAVALRFPVYGARGHYNFRDSGQCVVAGHVIEDAFEAD